MTNGKKKMAYGKSAEDALEVLALRLTPLEMEQIIPKEHVRVSQRDLQLYVRDLG